MSIKKISKIAKKKGLDGLAITDHNTIDGFPAAEKISKDMGLLYIPGVELRIEKTDYLVYFIDDPKVLEIKNLEELIDFVHESGGIVAIAHPYRSGYEIPSLKIVQKLDAVEVFNAKNHEHENRNAKILQKKYMKGSVAGSDAHIYSYVGLGSILVNATEIEEVKKAIIKNNLRILGHMPTEIQTIKNILNSIKYIPRKKKKYYLRHPYTALRKIREK